MEIASRLLPLPLLLPTEIQAPLLYLLSLFFFHCPFKRTKKRSLNPGGNPKITLYPFEYRPQVVPGPKDRFYLWFFRHTR